MELTPETTARSILKQVYPAGYQIERLPSRNSAVFVVTPEGEAESVVLKIPKGIRDEALREQKIIDSLESISIPVPPVLYTQENKPIENLVYTITRYIKGPSIGEIIQQDDQTTEDIFTQIGRLAAELAAVPLKLVPDSLRPTRTQDDELDWWERHLDFVTRHRRTNRILELLYHAARGIMLVPPTVFGHRDGVQVVTDGTNVFMVDTGAAGANWPDADFARLLYGGITWHDGAMYRLWRESVQSAYLEGRTLSDADVERIIILMVYYAMRDAAYMQAQGKASHVENQYDVADFILTEVRKWFGR